MIQFRGKLDQKYLESRDQQFSYCILNQMLIFTLGLYILSSASVNGILQCGLGGQKLYKGEKRDLSSKMRPKCGPILELLRTEESLFSSKYHKIFKN